MIVEKTMCYILFKDSEVIDYILACFTFGVKRLSIFYIPKLLLSLKSEGCLQFLILKCFPAPSDEEGKGSGMNLFSPRCVNTDNWTDFLYLLGKVQWVCFIYSAQFQKSLCRTEVIPKLCLATSFPLSLGECLCLRQVLNQAPLVQHHVLLWTLCVLQRQDAAVGWWKPRAAFPPGSDIVMLCPYPTLCSALVFYFSLLSSPTSRLVLNPATRT